MVMHSGVKLRHLRMFLQVADSGGLTAAAQVLGLSQPAISKSLTELETLLGVALFQRLGRRVQLTEGGGIFRRHARDALAALDAGTRAASGQSDRARIAVGLLPTVSTRFFPDIMAQFLHMDMQVTLSVETGSHPVLLAKLRAREIDLMIGRMPKAAEMAGLDFEYLYEEPIIAAIRAGHPDRRTDIATLLRKNPLILPTRDAIIRKTVDDYLASLGLSNLAPAIETSTLALGRGILLASDAVWFISRGVVAAELAMGQFIAVPLAASYLSGAVGMTCLADNPLPMAIQTLMHLSRQAAKNALSGGS